MRKARSEGKYVKIDPEKKKEYMESYYKKFPEKEIAKNLSQHMTPKPCEVCGSTENIEGHHEDYSKPKAITWLCRKHHYERHVQMREEELIKK